MDLLKRLQQLIKLRVKEQKEFAKLINIAPNTLSHYVTGKRKIPLEIIVKIAKYTNCDLHWLLTGEGEMFRNISHPISDDSCQVLAVESEISAGPPVESQEYPLQHLSIGTSVIPDVSKVFCFQVNGYSMEPDISHGDLVIIRKTPCWNNTEGKICAIRTDGEITLKRVLHDVTNKSIILVSNNIKYSPIILDPKHNSVELLGILDTIIRKV